NTVRSVVQEESCGAAALGGDLCVSEDGRAIGHRIGQLLTAPMRERPKNRIQNLIKTLANIFAEEPQYMIAVFLEQNVFAPITPVRVGIIEVLTAIQFD